MKKNINKTDRIVRAIIGIILIALSVADFFEDTIVDNAFLIVGAVLILASIIQICPLYYFLGINTHKKKKFKMY
jgi:heme/copper-type cytochrome/quinol oxidase subunit 4